MKQIGMPEVMQNMSPIATYSVRHSSQDVTMEEMKNPLGVLMNMDLNDKAEMTVIFFNHGWTECLFAKMCLADKSSFQMFLMFHLCPPNALGKDVTSRAQK
jgi:hypothetical protein